MKYVMSTWRKKKRREVIIKRGGNFWKEKICQNISNHGYFIPEKLVLLFFFAPFHLQVCFRIGLPLELSLVCDLVMFFPLRLISFIINQQLTHFIPSSFIFVFSFFPSASPPQLAVCILVFTHISFSFSFFVCSNHLGDNEISEVLSRFDHQCKIVHVIALMMLIQLFHDDSLMLSTS
uniref:Transmembrane protein n=1 Tax=Parascaris univalens TaxID=6257 RepID=A0A915AZY5_PARUN